MGRQSTDGPMTWSKWDDMVKVVGKDWMQKARDPKEWGAFEDTYNQHWVETG